MTFTLHPDWIKDPMVKHAMVKAESDPRRLLFELNETMLDIEDRFPGVPFSTIMSARDKPRPKGLRALLASKGASDADLDLLFA